MLGAIRSIVFRSHRIPKQLHLIYYPNLRVFRIGSFERWRLLTADLDSSSPEKFPDGYYEFSVHPTHATPADNLTVLRERLSHARRTKLTGWTPFLEMHRNEWRPMPLDSNIEAWVGRRTDDNTAREPQLSDYWRVSRNGQLYTIRGYTEDSIGNRSNVKPGTVLDLTLPVWRIGEMLYFTSRFIEEFEEVQTVLIYCKFTGLSGRTITSLNNDRWANTRSCQSDHVEMTANVTLPQLQSNMVEIVHQLLIPLYEKFDFYILSRTLVEEELAKLRENRY